jgi:hypothetical protein
MVNFDVIGRARLKLTVFEVRFFGISGLGLLMSDAVLQAKIVARKYSRIIRL